MYKYTHSNDYFQSPKTGWFYSPEKEGDTQKHGTFEKRTVVIESSHAPAKTLRQEGRLSPLAKLGHLWISRTIRMALTVDGTAFEFAFPFPLNKDIPPNFKWLTAYLFVLYILLL